MSAPAPSRQPGGGIEQDLGHGVRFNRAFAGRVGDDIRRRDESRFQSYDLGPYNHPRIALPGHVIPHEGLGPVGQIVPG
ncbi:MAG: hypothetical protein OSB69_11010 [Alphaproteobacteria bacterium]|nr:hypothetical protein [Alphaproteobacteria bacterium]